ncbi:hypothetical protein F2Q69_00054942 [Brassica cretica]|uniref:RING-type E3 ubiquitin transferase n=1 Tax=Brassica cretica TaxID=69181 RepID=A0A8S9N010_BRACR|nr:hypothetical protein F2Q69_00054942 [Brassica cretica]
MEEVSRLRVLLDNISSYLSISSSSDKLSSNPAHKYYSRVEEISKLLMPVLDNLVASDASLTELLNNGFEELSQYIDELREQFESWQPLSSRIFYVLTRSASAPGIVSKVVSKANTSISQAPVETVPQPCIIPATMKETGSSSNMEAEETGGSSNMEVEVKKLIQDLKSSSLDAQREATAQLRLLTKDIPDNRTVIARCGAIAALVNKLYSMDKMIQADAVTCLLNLSLDDSNKTVIAYSGVFKPLVHVLKTGNMEAKENSTRALVSLSKAEENRTKMLEAGAIEPLVRLMGNGSPRGKKDAATALTNLATRNKEKEMVIRGGGVRYLIQMMNPAAGTVERAVVVLANLANVPEAKIAIRDGGGIPLLVEVVELGSPRGQENAAAALCLLCMDSSRFCNTVIREGAIPPLVALTRSGTARAKEKAKSLLKYFEALKQENQRRS